MIYAANSPNLLKHSNIQQAPNEKVDLDAEDKKKWKYTLTIQSLELTVMNVLCRGVHDKIEV